MKANPGGGRDGRVPFEVEEITMPATIGWHWINEDGTEYSITWVRWQTTMIMGIRMAGREEWSSTVMAREWANHTRTTKDARDLVRAWFAANHLDGTEA